MTDRYLLLFLCLMGTLCIGFCDSSGDFVLKTTIDFMDKFYKREKSSEEKNEPGTAASPNAIITAAQPQVKTTSGLIYGVNNSHAHSFYSIPYALPPVGDLRFQPSQMLDTPGATRNLSTKTGVYCAMPSNSFNEDCLVLNVHVPAFVNLSDPDSPPEGRLPVLFFIHGGAFFTGAGTYSLYDGRFLSEATSTVVVTINYRLGPLGFLVFDDGKNSFEGNQGLKDQRLALEWVHKNIENFGGNATKITIFGESTGAQSVMFHLVSQVSDPLFHRAIMQSNPAVYTYPTSDEALTMTDRLVVTLRCNPLNVGNCCVPLKSNFTCLMEASTEQLINGMLFIMGREWTELDVALALEPFRPYIDGTEFIEQPMILFKEGRWNKRKPIILGSNEEEALFLKYLLPLNKPLFQGVNQRLFEGLGVNENTGDMISEKYIEKYPNETDYGHIFGVEMTDIWFGCPSRALARFISKTTEDSVYYYIFGHALDGEDCEEQLGFLCGHSYHSAELYFVFRTIEHVGMIPDDHDVWVSNQFSNYWGNLAWSGNPSEGPGFELEGEFPNWEKYGEHSNSYSKSWVNLRLANPDAFSEKNYRGEMCDFWDTLGVYPAPYYESQPPTAKTQPSIDTTTSKGRKLSNGTVYLVVTICLICLAKISP